MNFSTPSHTKMCREIFKKACSLRFCQTTLPLNVVYLHEKCMVEIPSSPRTDFSLLGETTIGMMPTIARTLHLRIVFSIETILYVRVT